MEFPIERWHPITVHFPIAFLLLGTVLISIALIFPKLRLRKTAVLLLVLGTAGAWIAVWTGHLADGEVARTICDPGILKQHEQYNTVSSWLFSVASLLLPINLIKDLKPVICRSLSIIGVILCFTGSGMMGYAAHLGGHLVYDQGAGVHQPQDDCSDYN